jgi:hypothetical protein
MTMEDKELNYKKAFWWMFAAMIILLNAWGINHFYWKV